MTPRFDLTIAGLRFSVSGPPGFDVGQRDSLYGPFIDSAMDADLMMEVRLTCEPEPDRKLLALLFDTQETWTAHQIDGDILLRLPNPADPGYLWTARLAGDFERATVYCSPLLTEQEGVITNPIHYPLDQILSMFRFSNHRGLIIHAAGVVRGDCGVFCAGRSGAGKTTLMRQWRNAPNIDGLSDDRVVIREIDGRFKMYGTPWAGEGRIAAPAETSLRAITFIHHGEENLIRSISPVTALTQLLPTSSILWFDKAATERTLDLCHDLVNSVPAYEVHCRPDPSAVDLIDQLFT